MLCGSHLHQGPVALKEGKINDGRLISWPSFSSFPPAFPSNHFSLWMRKWYRYFSNLGRKFKTICVAAGQHNLRHCITAIKTYRAVLAL